MLTFHVKPRRFDWNVSPSSTPLTKSKHKHSGENQKIPANFELNFIEFNTQRIKQNQSNVLTSITGISSNDSGPPPG